MDERKMPVHGSAPFTLNVPEIQFVTPCTKDRRRLLANEQAHQLIRESWAVSGAWLVGRYVIMPDHIHLFCSPSGDLDLTAWVKFVKSFVANRWPNPSELPLWQKSHWDYRMRDGESYSNKWEYVRQNPVRAGLVERPEDWPFCGEIHDLRF